MNASTSASSIDATSKNVSVEHGAGLSSSAESMTSRALYVWLLTAAIATAACIGCSSKPPTVIQSSAQAWIWVPENQQDRFVKVLQDFAALHGLVCNPSKPPSPIWPVLGFIIVTPKNNEVTVLNATAPEKFNAAIALEHDEPDWQTYWSDFRAAVSPEFKWEKIL
jgi:hypothetical protein